MPHGSGARSRTTTLGFVPSATAVRRRRAGANFSTRRYQRRNAFDDAHTALPSVDEVSAARSAAARRRVRCATGSTSRSLVMPMRRTRAPFLGAAAGSARQATSRSAGATRLDLVRRVVELEKPAHTVFDVSSTGRCSASARRGSATTRWSIAADARPTCCRRSASARGTSPRAHLAPGHPQNVARPPDRRPRSRSTRLPTRRQEHERLLAVRRGAGRCRADPRKRVNFVHGLVLGADDLTQESTFLADRGEWLARDLLGYGTVSRPARHARAAAAAAPGSSSDPGFALSPRGRPIAVSMPQAVVLDEWLDARGTDMLTDLVPGLDSPPGDLLRAVRRPGLPPVRHRRSSPGPASPAAPTKPPRVFTRLADDFVLELRLRRPASRTRIAHAVARCTVAARDRDCRFAAGGRRSTSCWRRCATAALSGSPPSPTLASPPEPLRVHAADAGDFFRAAFGVWTTELRPLLRTCAPVDDAVLLAEVEAAGRRVADGRWLVEDASAHRRARGSAPVPAAAAPRAGARDRPSAPDVSPFTRRGGRHRERRRQRGIVSPAAHQRSSRRVRRRRRDRRHVRRLRASTGPGPHPVRRQGAEPHPAVQRRRRPSLSTSPASRPNGIRLRCHRRGRRRDPRRAARDARVVDRGHAVRVVSTPHEDRHERRSRPRVVGAAQPRQACELHAGHGARRRRLRPGVCLPERPRTRRSRAS